MRSRVLDAAVLGMQKAFKHAWNCIAAAYLHHHVTNSSEAKVLMQQLNPSHTFHNSGRLQNEPHTTDLYERNRGWPPGQLVRNWIWEMAAYVKSVDGNHMVGPQHNVMCGSTVCMICWAVLLPELTSAQPCMNLCNQRMLKEHLCLGVCKTLAKWDASCRSARERRATVQMGPPTPHTITGMLPRHASLISTAMAAAVSPCTSAASKS